VQNTSSSESPKETPEISLYLKLCAEDAEPTGATELKVLAGARASLELSEGRATVEVALPKLPRVELRYVVDQAIRALGGVVSVGPVVLSAAGVSDETLLTIALDLHHRSEGRVTIPENAAVQSKMETVARAEDLYRAWVNEDPSTRTSIAIAADVSSWASKRDEVSVQVMEEPELREKGLNLLVAVGGSSDVSPPRLVLAEYRPKGNSDAPLAIVGKGVTFDTGGINVKPYASFVSMMKNDMGGAALAVALFQSMVEAGYDKPLLLVVPTCENAVGERAMRPGALVKSYAGKTVRIDHTDAEGRLILADGIAYAGEKFKPHSFLCFATLTTSALNSYGPFATPVHFADAALQGNLEEAALRMGEDFHFFPERLWHTLANNDEEADLRNTARLPGHASAGAGSRNAAHFLLHFANAPLCHFDIFASTWNWSGQAPGVGYGATGAPLRTLLSAFLKS
jgi:leucyl aminopeptidase